MFFLKDHLIEGTFTTAYCDTDSMALATCRTDEELNGSTMEEKLRAVFDPIVKPEMRNHWEANWKKWFVTEDTVEDEKFPGKLKCKAILIFNNLNFYYRGIFFSARTICCTVLQDLLCLRC